MPRFHYPPCISFWRCAEGKKVWPELVGMKAKDAKAIIEKENLEVTVVYIPRDAKTFAYFCCKRVYLSVHTDRGGVYDNADIFRVPSIG